MQRKDSASYVLLRQDGSLETKETFHDVPQRSPTLQDAAGAQSLGRVSRKEGLKANFVPGTSQVDEARERASLRPLGRDQKNQPRFDGTKDLILFL